MYLYNDIPNAKMIASMTRPLLLVQVVQHPRPTIKLQRRAVRVQQPAGTKKIMKESQTASNQIHHVAATRWVRVRAGVWLREVREGRLTLRLEPLLP